MSKSKGFVAIALIVIATVFFGYMDIFGFGPEKAGSAKDIILGLDLHGGVSITYQVVGDENPSQQDLDDTVYKLQQRVANYSTEAVVYKEGSNRINIEIPGVFDANAILQELGNPGTLYFIKHYGNDGIENYSYAGGQWYLNRSLDEIKATDSIVLEGSDVVDAQAGISRDDMGNSEIMVHLTLSDAGKAAFRDATEEAYNNGRDVIAIYYDGEFASVPRVNSVINDGIAQITGQQSYEEAEKLASTIRIGSLSLELEELRSNVVGASLGQEAISSSIKAGIIGFAAVIVLMIAIYFLFGAAASIALALYVTLEVFLINAFGITLTLPGIAGFILSIGMAVDANVIIFARVREELRAGSNIASAIKVAYSKAMSAIIDGNITTLIAAIVLWVMGSVSIRGFAQTLTLGICLSMFTAIVITKLLLNSFVAIGVTNTKVYGVSKEPKKIDFLSKKGIFFSVSGAVILIGIIAMLFVNPREAGRGNKLNFSLEFLGGTQTSVTFNEDYSLEEISEYMVSDIEKIVNDPNVITNKVQGSNEVIFKTVVLNADQREELNDYFADNYGVDVEKIQSESISSTISAESQRETIIAVVIACVLMLIYIWFRFKDIRFGAASVIALTHDVLVTLAFYALAYVSVGSTFVACMLTIVGYSINATIVVFDRVRENLKEAGPKSQLKDIVNDSISQTLSRSIFTSLTTFIMVVALYIFGVSSIREFALPLMVGIICGAYSSVCLAGSLWFVFRKNVAKK